MSILKIRNMKKVVLSLVLMIAAVTVSAQQIAVVSSSGATTMCQTLGDAISKASSNSVIYLPAGGFQISDDVKISKKLTIVGVTHKANSDNVEGNTIISGNLNFVGGSDNSAVMGCYISGNVNIGHDDSEITGILIKYCNLNSVQVKRKGNESTSLVSGTKVNQCYVRSGSYFGFSSISFTNNVVGNAYVEYIKGGKIANNIFCNDGYALLQVYSVSITDNYFHSSPHTGGDGLTTSGNMCYGFNWGDNPINAGLSNRSEWNQVFQEPLGCTPASNFHFKEKYAEYEGKVGIYGGTGFSEGCMPPVPYVSVKEIDEQTDAAGNLKVTLRVKAANN